jgi:UDP-2,3-diacylglucosamine pyrophosphatase LpxH
MNALRWLFAACVLGAASVAANAAANPYFISDLHLGVGKNAQGQWSPLEDFRWHDAIVAFLDHVSAVTHDDAELVILGDMLELWQSSKLSCVAVGPVVSCNVQDCAGSNTGCSEKDALSRTAHVTRQHDVTLKALGSFAVRGNNRIVIVPGNHDAALLLPSVAALLKKAIGAPEGRVVVEKTGRWQSKDGLVVAEHGHQFDPVNAFAGWPAPFSRKDGGGVLFRPGGELLVQTFYNRYEQQFEAIDNFATETEGLGYAIRELGTSGVVVGIGDFAYFLLVRSTFDQMLDWLGGADEGGDVAWDVAQIRKSNDVALLIGSLPLQSPERAALAEAHRRGELASLLGRLTDDEISMLCDRAEFLLRKDESAPSTGTQCPTLTAKDGNLGYFAGKLLKRDDDDLMLYLAKAREDLKLQKNPFKLFVYGHTHSARQPRPIKVTPEWEVSVVNTGAFQRIASAEFIASLPLAERNSPTFLSDLKLERLPECYSFVRLKRQGYPASGELRFWRREAVTGRWEEGEACRKP